VIVSGQRAWLRRDHQQGQIVPLFRGLNRGDQVRSILLVHPLAELPELAAELTRRELVELKQRLVIDPLTGDGIPRVRAHATAPQGDLQTSPAAWPGTDPFRRTSGMARG
jgi:hypothetical protein